MLTISREQALAHRWRAQELHRPRAAVACDQLAVLDLGVADVPSPAARTALAVRGGSTGTADDLALVWGARGAAALHRRGSLQSLAEALWPASDDDAARRLANPRFPGAAALGIAAFRAVAQAVHDVLAGAGDQLVTKAQLSRGVSDRIPDELNHDCEPCAARHVSGAVLQDAGLAGGAELVRAGRAAQYRLLPEVRIPDERRGLEELVAAYLHLLGPATPSDVAGYFGVTAAEIGSAWPSDVVEFSCAGRTVTALAADESSVRSRARARGVRLLPPGDPWLQARDRAVTVAAQHHRTLWRPISAPGALLVDGEVLGTWRAAAKGRRLDVSVEGFEPLAASVRAQLQPELDVVAAGRGLGSALLL